MTAPALGMRSFARSCTQSFTQSFTRAGARAAASPLARNSAAGLAATALRLGVQALYFVALARALPVAGYGAFVAAAGLVGLASPFASWGAGDLLVQRVAREGAVWGPAWGEALGRTLRAGFACALVVPIAGRLLLPSTVPTLLIASVAAAEFLGGALVSVGAQAFQARERLGRSGAAWVALSAARLAGAALLLAGAAPRTPTAWGLAYLVTSLLAAAAVAWRVGAELGRPERPRVPTSNAGRQGFQYALGLAALSFYNDIDKTMLARLATLAATGAYGAGYRMVELSFAPVTALLTASYARFFRAGATGVAPVARLARRLLPAALAYAGIAALALALGAPFGAAVLGRGYGEVAAVVRALAPLPVIRAVQYFAANALTAGGRQSARSAAQVLAAAVNVLLNLAWIPAHGWRGAAWATLAAEGALAAGLWACVAWHARGERQVAVAAPAAEVVA